MPTSAEKPHSSTTPRPDSTTPKQHGGRPRSPERQARDARQDRKQATGCAITDFRAHIDDPTAVNTAYQAVFHFERVDQIDALVAVRDEEPDIGFMMRLLALCTLPRTDPGKRTQYVRRNGPYTLVMSATAEQGRLPFGILPRLALAWVCTEAVRTQSRTITLGRSLTSFMRAVGITNDSGGRRGDLTRMRTQLQRLFTAAVSLSYDDEKHHQSVAGMIATHVDLWWDPRDDGPMLLDSQIELGQEFFDEIIRRPVPIDMNVLRALKRSSLGLDVYMWLTYRLFGLTKPFDLAWTTLNAQFAKNPTTDPNAITWFRRDMLRELRKIHTAWPEFEFGLPSGRLRLLPTQPRITPRD